MFTKTLSKWFGRTSRSRQPAPLSDEARWAADPLSHPVLKAMTAAELADLTLPRYRVDQPSGRRCAG
ncbi:hypothetical protein [Bauldia litoralis]|uniref:hypothetical protein n=1 Tax=Bauldia litoralis TaxID=665467 RepID=UPI0011145EC2|nr:hypothetical protein [Bauldia litoralis]